MRFLAGPRHLVGPSVEGARAWLLLQQAQAHRPSTSIQPVDPTRPIPNYSLLDRQSEMVYQSFYFTSFSQL